MVHNVANQVSKYFGLLVILNAFQRLKPQYVRSTMYLVSTKLPCLDLRHPRCVFFFVYYYTSVDDEISTSNCSIPSNILVSYS